MVVRIDQQGARVAADVTATHVIQHGSEQEAWRRGKNAYPFVNRKT